MSRVIGGNNVSNIRFGDHAMLVVGIESKLHEVLDKLVIENRKKVGLGLFCFTAF